MKEIQVDTGYFISRILVGEKLDALLGYTKGKNLVIITDNNVYSLYKKNFPDAKVLIIDTGEKIKTLETVEKLYSQLLAYEIDRTAFIVGIGGGIVCDIAGYTASTYLRGLSFGFVSTTLLSQVDASVGGKNGVNFKGFKNMIGTFNQPEFVICDTNMLSTLPERDFVSGFAEIIKHGAIKSEPHLQFLEKNLEALLLHNHELLQTLVAESVEIKATVVAADEKEAGERRKLNFGHTFGHAIEKMGGHTHGEAVSLGMLLAAGLSVKLGFLSQVEANRLKSILEKTGLPVKITVSPMDLLDAMKMDKKRQGDEINFVLLKKLGSAIIHKMEYDDLKSHLHDLYQYC